MQNYDVQLRVIFIEKGGFSTRLYRFEPVRTHIFLRMLSQRYRVRSRRLAGEEVFIELLRLSSNYTRRSRSMPPLLHPFGHNFFAVVEGVLTFETVDNPHIVVLPGCRVRGFIANVHRNQLHGFQRVPLPM